MQEKTGEKKYKAQLNILPIFLKSLHIYLIKQLILRLKIKLFYTN
jgi:hypothetical protein